MNAEKRKFKCNGCGDERPCYVETNQEPSNICDVQEDLICVLDITNQTSYYWEEITQVKSNSDKNNMTNEELLWKAQNM